MIYVDFNGASAPPTRGEIGPLYGLDAAFSGLFRRGRLVSAAVYRLSVQHADPPSVVVVSLLEESAGALGAEVAGGGEDLWRGAGLGQQPGDLGLDQVDDRAAGDA